MTVLQEILEWSKYRPHWQRDALRRLVLNGDLSSDDIRSLTEICKANHGLAEHQQIDPIGTEHVADHQHMTAAVSLVSIFHHRGVNALAEDQTLKFGQHLNVVYGDNAAGKTGYIRILKSACRARGREEIILGNVVGGAMPPTPVVAIRYRIGSDKAPRDWTGHGEDSHVSRVSVFDTQSAVVYLNEKTDVAFRPFGLDLFDKLVRACKEVRNQLEREQRALSRSSLTSVQAQIPSGTDAAKLVSSVTSLTKPEIVRALTRLSKEEESRHTLVEKSLIDMQTSDPERLVRQLVLRVGRIRTLAKHIRAVETVLSDDNFAMIFEARSELHRMIDAANKLREDTFSKGTLTGTGSEHWSILWEAARRFSEESAFPSDPFPKLDEGASCVLCQQELEDPARRRLHQFENFVASTTGRELRRVRAKFEGYREAVDSLQVSTSTIHELLEEIRIENEAVSGAVAEALAIAEQRRRVVTLALAEDQELAADCPVLRPVRREVDSVASEIDGRIETLRSNATAETRMRLTEEAQELRARKLLAQHEQTIFDEIERKKRYAAYGMCVDDTKTHTITMKSTSVTRRAVTERIKLRFLTELRRLDFKHVEVELKEVGGREGVLYHKLALTRAPGVELPRVVSEGEQRCLSIAAFFAELSTADDPSGIVFDDPVSSLDYKWREAVAHRLVEEARTRQVIVFTHDIVFLLLLRQYADDASVEQHDQHVRQLSNGAGVCTEELPWVALKVSKRIGHLKKDLQDADKLHRDGYMAAYEKEAGTIYGYLREAWERGLEEVLLGGVVERYRPGVQTQQIALIADINSDDCMAVKRAMTKCSKWLPGHDQAAAARAEIPDPAELKADVAALDEWVTTIRKRRS